MNQNLQQRQYLEGQNIDHEKIEIPGQREKNAADFECCFQFTVTVNLVFRIQK